MIMDFINDFRESIKKFRYQTGLSQEEFGEFLIEGSTKEKGFSAKIIGKYEHGSTRPRLENREIIIKKYKEWSVQKMKDESLEHSGPLCPKCGQDNFSEKQISPRASIVHCNCGYIINAIPVFKNITVQL